MIGRPVATLLALLAAATLAAGGAGAQAVYPAGAPPVLSEFHSMMGANRLPRRQRHQGIDFAGPDGGPVLAAADGIVLEAVTEACWGPTIMVDHGRAADGRTRLVALYGHVEAILVAPGQQVRRGQPIARLGNNQRGFRCMAGVRHLHFQLGQQPRTGPDRGRAWGHTWFLHDGGAGLDPHRFWADGPNRPTCFDTSRRYPPGSLTLPVPCSN